jgi:hypothetical protein
MDARCTRESLQIGQLAILVLGVSPLLTGAAFRSANFAVEAQTREVAERVALRAEVCRTAVAKAWLGRELPKWHTRCPVRVRLTASEAGGITSFGFERGQVTDQHITVEGRLDRILDSAIPHEVTHTIFASYFGEPMPRWADEGASLLSEDERERLRHDQIAADLLARRGEVSISRLFQIQDYPEDLMSFYAQGYSISRFLIEIGGRPRFLRFVRDGVEHGWDRATRVQYQLANVRELERAWRAWHSVTVLTHTEHRDSTTAVHR